MMNDQIQNRLENAGFIAKDMTDNYPIYDNLVFVVSDRCRILDKQQCYLAIAFDKNGSNFDVDARIFNAVQTYKEAMSDYGGFVCADLSLSS